MAKLSEYVEQLQTLTQKNLEILQAINDSFFTKREHLTVQVGDSQYVMPSFLSLENKINALTENFNNLTYAPKTGEATFNFDGNSRTIEVKGYTCTPNRLTIDVSAIKGFNVEQNDIFKDFMTPMPYFKVDLQMLPNDISRVNVRKIAFKSDAIIDRIATLESTKTCSWADVNEILYDYKEDEDYVMYDTIYQLPIRKAIGSGEYVIKSIDNDVTNSDLDEYITLTFYNDLKYTLFDETMDKNLEKGDQLVTYDNSAKVEITDINYAARQLTVKVLNGDYLNLVANTDLTKVSDLSKLKFFCPVDYQNDKYLNIPLEEDKHIAVFIAALNDRMNIQAPWGDGICLQVHDMVLEGTNTKFIDYYKENVRNVGDILFEISSVMSNTIMGYSEDDFNRFHGYKPVLDASTLKVTQINNHLNNSETVKNIRSLYSQKQAYITQLNEVNEKIDDINKQLSEIAFTDTTGVRSSYEAQLSQYTKRKNELNSSITKTIDEISVAANESTIPLENAKYHIRGYYDWFQVDDIMKTFGDHVHGIKVQYRYKNMDSTTGSAETIGKGFIYSDWNDMESFILQKNPSYAKGTYVFRYPQYDNGDGTTSQNNGKQNEPSFNQIDIPISQGETVDIRLKVIWDFGYPFIETTSDWSEILNVSFPDEYLKDVKLLDIVEENNDDIETNRFHNILKEDGVTAHVEDRIQDQDITYFHKPESISSGFYTAERRIIPLRDKLTELDNAVLNLQDLINGTSSENLQFGVVVDGTETIVYPGQLNHIVLPAYSTLNSDELDNNIAQISVTLQITNTSKHTAYIYSMFPGSKDTPIRKLTNPKYKLTDYVTSDATSGKLDEGTLGGVWLDYQGRVDGDPDKWTTLEDQKCNQWITFRRNNPYDNTAYYGWITDYKSGQLSDSQEYTLLTDPNKLGMTIYPYLADKTSLIIPGDSVYSKMTLSPTESLVIPLMAQYHLNNASGSSGVSTILKTMSFDIRTSLYNDPTNITIEFQANNTDSIRQKVAGAAKARLINRTSLQRGVSSTLQQERENANAARAKSTIVNQ